MCINSVKPSRLLCRIYTLSERQANEPKRTNGRTDGRMNGWSVGLPPATSWCNRLIFSASMSACSLPSASSCSISTRYLMRCHPSTRLNTMCISVGHWYAALGQGQGQGQGCSEDDSMGLMMMMTECVQCFTQTCVQTTERAACV